MVMEAEKSHHLPPANWRTRKPVGVVLSKSESLRTRSSNSQRQEEMDIPAQEEIERICPSLTFLALWGPMRLDDVHPHR